ncbi:hypothetical protein HTZ77_02070 [Nonomuraea sp. SMC257]|uniref:WXG100 family type VII secretion target n=1 Tax=Nonomuraea montanisoli TaxID=2741721 RepID=A0A7Y6I469_9ACTN|nr:hypothetical protein [Nonomuraea montanisoli]NUW30219.1 hypothetical protein [Nonomuraea montanisoli]
MADERIMAAAIATATAAAGLIGGKWPWYVVGIMGTLYGHVSGMGQTTQLWKTTGEQGLIGELDELMEDMAAFKKRLQDEGKWEGSAWEAFEGVYDSFRKGAEDLGKLRNLNGDGVKAAEKIFGYVVLLCGVVATGMLIFGIRKRIMSLVHPAGAVIAEGESAVQGATTTGVAKGTAKKQLMVLASLGGVLYMANQQAEMTGKLFPMMKTGLPTEMSSLKNGTGMPPFSGTALQYDKSLGLSQKMDDPSKTMKI